MPARDTISISDSSDGISAYGEPARRNAVSTSNSPCRSPCSAYASSVRGTSTRASTPIRPNTAIGVRSRSGRSRRHCSRIRSIWSMPPAYGSTAYYM
jgi:hypothetical protein